MWSDIQVPSSSSASSLPTTSHKDKGLVQGGVRPHALKTPATTLHNPSTSSEATMFIIEKRGDSTPSDSLVRT